MLAAVRPLAAYAASPPRFRQVRVGSGRFGPAAQVECAPIAPNTKPNGADDPDGRQKNRRVEITVRT